MKGEGVFGHYKVLEPADLNHCNGCMEALVNTVNWVQGDAAEDVGIASIVCVLSVPWACPGPFDCLAPQIFLTGDAAHDATVTALILSLGRSSAEAITSMVVAVPLDHHDVGCLRAASRLPAAGRFWRCPRWLVVQGSRLRLGSRWCLGSDTRQTFLKGALEQATEDADSTTTAVIGHHGCAGARSFSRFLFRISKAPRREC